MGPNGNFPMYFFCFNNFSLLFYFFLLNFCPFFVGQIIFLVS